MQAERGNTRVFGVKEYYKELMTIPLSSDGVVYNPQKHVDILSSLDGGPQMYYTEPDDLFVGDWNIAGPEIYHRHKELGTFTTMDGMNLWAVDDLGKCPCGCEVDSDETHVQYDAAKGLCGLCNEQMPGEIMMMHKFYQF